MLAHSYDADLRNADANLPPLNNPWRYPMALLRSKAGAKKRINMLLPERTVERIERLRVLTDASSYGEVIKDALFAYDILVNRLAKGAQLMESFEGKLQPLALAIDVHADIIPIDDPAYAKRGAVRTDEDRPLSISADAQESGKPTTISHRTDRAAATSS